MEKPLPHELEPIFAILAAEDNIPFVTIARSRALRPLTEYYVGKPVPKSANTVKEVVMRVADSAKAATAKNLKAYQKDGGKFSVAFDEATAANCPYRFLSITLRMEPQLASQSNIEAGQDVYLGLVKLSGRATAEVIGDAVKDRLSDYSVNLRNCHYAITDGASTMKLAAANLGLQSQLCMVHALHLALSKVLQMPTSFSVIRQNMTAIFERDEDDPDAGDLDQNSEDDEDAIEDAPAAPTGNDNVQNLSADTNLRTLNCVNRV